LGGVHDELAFDEGDRPAPPLPHRDHQRERVAPVVHDHLPARHPPDRIGWAAGWPASAAASSAAASLYGLTIRTLSGRTAPVRSHGAIASRHSPTSAA